MLLKADPVRRKRVLIHESEHDDSYVLHSQQDIQPVLDANEQMRRHFTSARDPHGEWGSFAGRIPAVIWDELVRKGIAFDDKALLRWLQDPDNRAFKIHPGRLA
jgi:hypothetical protein